MNESTERDIIQYTSMMLMEERGINNAVRSETTKLCELIEKKLQQTPTEFDKVYQIHFKHREFIGNILGKDMTVNVTGLILNDEAEIKKYNSIYQGNCSLEDSAIKIVAPIINDRMITTHFIGTIQHELTHLLQFTQRNNCDILGSKQGLYDMASDMYSNNSGLVRFLGQGIMLSFKIEEEAYGNNLYVQLKNTQFNDWRTAYENTAMFNYIKNIKEVIKCFKNESKTQTTDKIINDYLLKYNINRDKIIKLLEQTVERCTRRAGKIISLVHDEDKLFEFKIMDEINMDYNERFSADDFV